MKIIEEQIRKYGNPEEVYQILYSCYNLLLFGGANYNKEAIDDILNDSDKSLLNSIIEPTFDAFLPTYADLRYEDGYKWYIEYEGERLLNLIEKAIKMNEFIPKCELDEFGEPIF